MDKQLAEKAVELKHNGRNCCKAVAEVLSEYLEQDSNVKTTIAIITDGFRTGMGGMQATCGALCGAVMSAGLFTGGNNTGSISKKLHERFVEISGASICKDLKSIGENGKPLCNCDDCVRNAVNVFLEICKK